MTTSSSSDRRERPEPLRSTLQRWATEIGIDDLGITGTEPLDHGSFFDEWLQSGLGGQLDYLKDGDRVRPESLLPGARTLVVAAVKYAKSEAEPGAVAAYAQREDYHRGLRDALEELAGRMEELRAGSRTRVLVDTAPLLEREAAQRAGLGWIGKSTMLVHRRFGCYTLLGEILWTERVDPDTPGLDQCGTCTRCLDACPTDALLHPYEMDATQCLSYHSIERRGRIPEQLRAAQGERVFGCDACLHVCPVGGEIGDGALLPTLEWMRDAPLEELLTRTCESFKRNFGSSPVERTRKRGMLRALMVALGNSGRREAAAQIEAFTEHEDVDVRAQARWALQQLA